MLTGKVVYRFQVYIDIYDIDLNKTLTIDCVLYSRTRTRIARHLEHHKWAPTRLNAVAVSGYSIEKLPASIGYLKEDS